jgi:hypothetical protein
MSAIEIAVKECKKLESLLEQQFGATGRGLHEKVSSVGGRLPPELVKQIRYIATIRNNLVHEDAFALSPSELANYQATCTTVEQQIRSASGNSRTPRAESSPQRRAQKRTVPAWVAVAVCLIGAAFIYCFSSLFHLESSSPPEQQVRPAASASVQPVAAQDQVDKLLNNMDGQAAPPDAVTQAPPASDVILGPATLPMQVLSFRMGHDDFGSPQPTIIVRVTNETGETVSSVGFGGELFLDGSPKSVTRSGAQSWSAYFGDHGLKNGGTRVVALTLSFFEQSQWSTPDILNAKTRLIRLKVLRTDDGSRNSIAF